MKTYKHPEALKKDVREVLDQEPHKSALIEIIKRDGSLTEENITEYIKNYMEIKKEVSK